MSINKMELVLKVISDIKQATVADFMDVKVALEKAGFRVKIHSDLWVKSHPDLWVMTITR